MSDPAPKPPLTAKSTLDLLKDWKELIAFAALTLTSLLTAVAGQGKPYVPVIGFILAVVFVSVGTWIVHRKRKRTLARERAADAAAKREQTGKPQAAFRSLASFEERDELPGKSRRLEARAIATAVASDDFKFGIVCGDSGCGKTSMLRSEVTRSLQKLGFEVSYVRNPRQLESKAYQEPSAERLTREWRTLVRNHLEPTTRVLFLDQFEEWFIEYRDPELRRQIAQSLKRLCERAERVRVVCAIRRDFLIDFHDISNDLPQTISKNNLFHTQNFTIEQAVDVIKECATAEGLVVDDSFAEEVAHDLADVDQVRPPELQIVCTYLAVKESLYTAKYRQAGGTAGILAHYIQEALDASRDRGLAARVLRALCDFPAHAKRRAKTIEELGQEVTSDASQRQSLENLIQQFVIARILVEEKRQDETAFALMHDYLVDAVQLATTDASTKTEEANQLLRYYVGERSRTIPLKKLRFITRFAEPRRRSEPAARRLIRHSVIFHGLKFGVPVLAVAFLVSYNLIATPLNWSDTGKVQFHDSSGQTDAVSVGQPQRGRIFLRSKNRISIWDVRAADQLAALQLDENETASLSESGKYLLIRGSSRQRVVESSTGAEEPIPACQHIRFLRNTDDWIGCENYSENSRRDSLIYSLPNRQTIRSFEGSACFEVFVRHNRCLLVTYQRNKALIELSELSTGQKLATLEKDRDLGTFFFIADDVNGRIAEIADHPLLSRSEVSVWNAKDGSLIGKTDQNTPHYNPDLSYSTAFTFNGGKLLLSRPPAPTVGIVDVQSASNQILNVSLFSGRIAQIDSEHLPFALGSDKSGTEMLDPTTGEIRLLREMIISDDSKFVVNRRRDRAVIWNGNFVELWDLVRAKSWRLEGASGASSAWFTIEEDGVVVIRPNATISLFDSNDGSLVFSNQSAPGLLQIYYDKDCQFYNIWDASGAVRRITRGKQYFWGFRALKRC